MKKKNNGITLIALVITIIILLILAGISIASLTGNGLFAKTKQSKEMHEKVQAEEEIKVVLNEWQITKMLKNMTFKEFLDSKILSNEIDNYIELNNKNIEIYRRKYFLVVDPEGNIIEGIQRAKIRIENIKITSKEDGTEVEDYSQENGAQLIINFDVKIDEGKIIKIEPEVPYETDGKERKKTFKITSKIDNIEENREIIIDFSKKYRITEPKIKSSETEWTNEDITVEVDYGYADNTYIKEISIDSGKTYTTYTGPVRVEKNTVVKARIRGEIELESELKISNIDKIEPNEFKPILLEEVSSTELKITANTTDKEDTTGEYACSGIKEYQYYVYQDTNLICDSGKISNNEWIASNLTVGEKYNIYVEVWDNAGNKTKSEEIDNYQKLAVYKWEKFETKPETYYTYRESPATITQTLLGGWSGQTYRVYSPDSVDRETGYWTSIADINVFPSGTTSSNYWIALDEIKVNTSDTRKAKTIYRVNSCTMNGNSVTVISATQRTSYQTTEYKKDETKSLGYVYSSDPNAYPINNTKEVIENGKKVVYYYEKETTTLQYPIITNTGVKNYKKDGEYFLNKDINCTATDALGIGAYDGNQETFAGYVNTATGNPSIQGNAFDKYIQIDSSAVGKTINVKWADASSSVTIRMDILNEYKEVISTKEQGNGQNTTDQITITSNMKWIRFSVSDGYILHARIYEIY